MCTRKRQPFTSALARYTKPPTMDVKGHFTAHLAKEEDLICNRNITSTPTDLHNAMYGKEDDRGKHISGSADDGILARLLYSLGTSEPDLIEH